MAVLLLLLTAAALVVAAGLRRLYLAVSEIRRVRFMTADMPGPTPYPLIGNVLEFAGPPDDIYDTVQRLFSDYGPVMRLHLGHLTFVAISEPDDVEAIVTSAKTTDKSSVYSSLEPLMGAGLAILGGETWRRHRKAITPSLHLDILRDFVGIFHKRGIAFANQLAALEGTVFDVTPLSGSCANNTICETVMSSDVDEEDPERTTFVDAIPKALDHFMYRVWHPWFLSEWAYSFMRSQFPEYLEVKRVLTAFTQQIIRDKRLLLRNNNNINANNKAPKKRQAFLDHVLTSEEGAALSDDELAEEVKTIVTIASGSSMDALTFLIYTLAIRQDVQERVRQELDDILGEDVDRPLEFSDMAHLQYTERFIKEVLRYFTVVPVFARHMAEDFKLPSGYVVPRGCQVAIWLPYTHRNAKYFPDPDNFDPDRFLPENCRQRHPFAYMPFSAGPRNCIGQRYAIMFLKTVTAALVPRLKFRVPADGPKHLGDVRLKMNLTVSVRGGANIEVCRR
ncbi:cytochrome P450 4C1-like, partial [Thrips palmi]|uniref:Cytochrome P450 4C1-like n=1 Tax=Thrips palmi TaxID=161013 RepID=A0A6P8ZRZ6_THRPL